MNKVSIITPSGPTERKTIQNIVMQGETLAPLECSSLVDTIGKECIDENKFLYMYRGSVGVPPLTVLLWQNVELILLKLMHI